jgi:hypothetical protein
VLITPEYRELNREMHARKARYGTSGHKWANFVTSLAAMTGSVTVLDYGCGKGTLADGLTGLTVTGYDPAIPGKDAMPGPADIVVCTDVLEHVEPECVDAVIAHIRSLTRKVALLHACCVVGDRLLADGRPAHLTVKPPAWWAFRIGRHVPVKCGEDEFACLMPA